jgi:hypothetical protein
MGFTVYRPGGITDSAFLDYARLLRQSGIDLGKLPRILEPEGGRHWLHLWNNRAEAEAFVEEIRGETSDSAWEVLEVDSPGADGPLGPAVIQLLRQGDGLTLTLHPLSRVVIRSAFPQTVSATTYATLDLDSWRDFRRVRGGLAELVRQVAPNLTGLNPAELDVLGYSVVDADTNETLVSVLPAVPAQV